MSRLEDIERAVMKLSSEELARFRAWFEELDARRWDEQLHHDAKAGRLDALAEEALNDHRKGLTREL